MPKIGEYSREQFQHLLEEFFAPPAQRNNLSETEIRALAQKLNERVQIPFIRETQEEQILFKVILNIDSFLYDHLPNEIYDHLRDLDRGMDHHDTAQLIDRLTRCANEKLQIPYLPEFAEAFAIRFVISIVIHGAKRNMNFEQALSQETSLVEDFPTSTRHERAKQDSNADFPVQAPKKPKSKSSLFPWDSRT